jgi:hypothetical protein
MPCFASGADDEREEIASSRQSAGGAPTAEGRAARAKRDLRPNDGESTRVPSERLLRIETLVA